MSNKDAHLDRLQQVQIFRGLSRKELQHVSRQAETIIVEAGEVLVREGETGYEFFILLSGSVDVVRGQQQVATLTDGDFFGELALFDRAPRDATIRAIERSELLLIDCRRFQPLLDDVPLLARKVTAGLARRLRAADTSELVSH
jgi:CRP-like cAMP-binding protein